MAREILGNDMECIELPPPVNSFGVWERMKDFDDGRKIWDYSLPLLLSFMILFFSTWQTIFLSLKRIKATKFTSQVAAGLSLSFLSLMLGNYKTFRDIFFPADYRKNVISTMGAFGYTMFWFLMGVKMDLTTVFRTGKKAAAVGITSVIAPAIFSVLLFWKVVDTRPNSRSGSSTSDTGKAMIIGIQCLSSFPVIANFLMEMKIQNSELGRLGLASAIVSDLIGLILSTLFSFARVFYLSSAKRAIVDLVAVFFFFIFTFAVLRPAMFWVIKQTPEDKPVKNAYVYLIISIVFLSGAYWGLFDQFMPVGPFIIGLAVPDGRPLGSALTEKFDYFVSSVFLPFFVVNTSRYVNLKMAGDFNDLKLIIPVFGIKFMATFVAALVSKVSWKDAVALTLVMNTKGYVELAAYAFGLEQKLIEMHSFTNLTLSLFVGSYFLPVCIRILYDPSKRYSGYQRRDIIHLKPHSELRILSCIHKPDNIIPMINLLEASCPSTDYPVAVYVLHLIELIGQASPIFISHQLQKKNVGNHSYSDNVLISFDQFQRNFWGLVHVSIFTSVSSPKRMHEDISMVAFDKLTSLILLPFHRSWSIDGSTIVSESSMIRNLNCTLLETAPCSVGILADRSRIERKSVRESSKTSYQACMIFFGGKDDREALALAKRMTRDSRLNLTVVRIVSANQNTNKTSHCSRILDSKELEDIMHNNLGEEYVIYIEKTAKDGTETALILRSLVDEFDLFIVGRGTAKESELTKGLDQWSEFPELGIVGDWLASPDLDSRTSVLIVQHQKHIHS